MGQQRRKRRVKEKIGRMFGNEEREIKQAEETLKGVGKEEVREMSMV